MQLISDQYRTLNQDLHKDNKEYGMTGRKHVDMILNICRTFNTQDVLDYGCGKSTLALNLPFNIKQYDPAVAKYKALPRPADIVVCTDVLEHIEPVFLEDVLNHIQSLTRIAVFFSISTVPAKKTLPDGRNAHLLVKDSRWWMDRLLDRFDLSYFQSFDKEFNTVLFAKNFKLNSIGLQT